MIDRVAVIGAVQNALKNDDALKALVPPDRVFLLEATPDNWEPLLPYIATDSVTFNSSDTSDVADGSIATLTLSVWSREDAGPALAMRIGDAIRNVLNCWSNDDVQVIPATRRTGSNTLNVDRAWLDRATYRLLINGG
jgi:hypothetical protein